MKSLLLAVLSGANYFSDEICLCVCLSVLWRANGRTTRSYGRCKLADELCISDALFINKDLLMLHLERGSTWNHNTDKGTHSIALYGYALLTNFFLHHCFIFLLNVTESCHDIPLLENEQAACQRRHSATQMSWK